MRFLRSVLASVLLSFGLANSSTASPLFQKTGNILLMSNANVRIEYNLAAGTADFYWNNSKKIAAFYSGMGLDSGYIKGASYSSWSWSLVSSNQAVVTSTGAGLPILKQYFTLDKNDSFLVRSEITGSNLKANWMGPVVVDTTGSVNLGVTNDNRALVVPFDNDGFVRYNAQPMNSSATGYEVAAFYDNTTRNGLVVGSITHDVWKTGIFFSGANNKLALMNVFGGATSPWDADPHGFITGNVVSSPTMFVGFGADWRATMQTFTAENTAVVAPLPWTNGVPFGWNSWGVIQDKITYTDAIAASDYFFVNLINQHFSDNGVAFINLDSFWDNLDPNQLQSFAAHCHAHGEKAGIYTGPFVWFNSPTNATNVFVEGTTNTYRYSDILLRDHNGNFQTLDGGLAVDPTHPGTKQRIDFYINEFTNWGFDYVKVDFLSHGALEGIHYDTNVTTGIQAYNQGMQYFLNAINGRMFISESIAPLFPYQYSHSRRIACDAGTSFISNTEYTMNSVSYGWWLDNLYPFNDADLMVFGNGIDTNEAQSRLICCAITGVFLDGDDLTTTNGQAAAHAFLTNAAIDSVATVGRTFTPVEGNTGSSAANIFVRQESNTWCVAVFNYAGNSSSQTVNLTRAGLPPGTYTMSNMWDGAISLATNSVNISLAAKQSKLFRLIPYRPSNLRWTGFNNSTWDSSLTPNWQNISNSQTVDFNTGDQVTFDDTPGVPTTVNLSSTLSPASVLINSSNNQFSLAGAGKISGTNSLVKQGSSTVALATSNDFTGPVTIAGGTLQAGAGALSSVASLTVTNAATLDLLGNTISGSKPMTVSGAGVNGGGAIYNSGNDFYNQVFNVTLAGDTVFGGSHRWDLANGSSITGPWNVTMNLAGGYAEWDTVTLATNVGNLEVTQGAWGIKGMGNRFGNPNTSLTVDSEVDFWNSNFGTNSGYAKNIRVLPGAALKVLTSPNTHFDASVTLDNSAQLTFLFGSGSQTMTGPIVLNGPVHLTLGDSTVTFTNVISGFGGFVWDLYNNNLVFTASNTYIGPSVIGGGLTLSLSGNGSITKSSPIFFGGNDASAVHIDVTSRPDKTLSLGSGQTLSGIGAINGNLTVNSGATISPGGTNTTLGLTLGANPVGTLSAASNINLIGATIIKLNGPGTNDSICAGNSIVCGGALNLLNISAQSLAAGNTFQILASPNISGSFVPVTPAAPGPGLLWDFSLLASGQISVITALAPPVLNAVAASGGNLVFAISNGPPGGAFSLLGSTNLDGSSTNWTVITTNFFDSGGAFRITNPIVPGVPQQFYRLQLQ